MINSEQTLVGARQSQAWDEYGTPIQVYDDGFGPLWLYREASGLEAIVRAQTWESAYECCQDEIMTRVGTEDVLEAYGFWIAQDGKYWKVMDDVDDRFNGNSMFDTEEHAKEYCQRVILMQERDLIEGYEYQPNATGTGIVSVDLNGQSLQQLTPELAEALGIRVQIEE